MQDIHTYTVYLGSSGYARDVFKQSAIEMGAALGQRGKALVYGGMDAGLMGLVAKAALDNGAQVTGIIPEKIRDSERILRGLSETIMVHDLWDRKKRMFQMADVVVSLPGGYGTLDESLELLYWGYLHLHNKPLVLVNIEGYWDGLIAYLKSLPDYDERFLIVVDSTEDVFEATSHIQIPQPQPGLQRRHLGVLGTRYRRRRRNAHGDLHLDRRRNRCDLTAHQHHRRIRRHAVVHSDRR